MDAFGSEIEVEKDEAGKGSVRLKTSAGTPTLDAAITLAEKYSAAGVAFKSAIETFLPKVGEQRLLSQVSNLVQQGHPSELSLKRLGIKLGFPSSWTARKMIEHAFGEKGVHGVRITYIQRDGVQKSRVLAMKRGECRFSCASLLAIISVIISCKAGLRLAFPTNQLSNQARRDSFCIR